MEQTGCFEWSFSVARSHSVDLSFHNFNIHHQVLFNISSLKDIFTEKLLSNNYIQDKIYFFVNMDLSEWSKTGLWNETCQNTKNVFVW